MFMYLLNTDISAAKYFENGKSVTRKEQNTKKVPLLVFTNQLSLSLAYSQALHS